MQAEPQCWSSVHACVQGGESVAQLVAGHLQGQGLQASLHQLGCSAGQGSASASALSSLLAGLTTQTRPQVQPALWQDWATIPSAHPLCMGMSPLCAAAGDG